MTALAEEIRERIRRDGPISVATYMELCLHHPTHGYYRHGPAHRCEPATSLLRPR